MFHVELRQSPHTARAFNLTEDELRGRFVAAWLRGDQVDLGDRRWAPEQGSLTIYEGPRLRDDELGMGRGWTNAVRSGEDVTDRFLRARAAERIGSSLTEFKGAVLAHASIGRIGVHQVLWLANSEHPQQRVSERLALAEQAIWELLHERRLRMLRAEGPDDELEPVAQAEWQAALFDWATWADPRAPSLLLERLTG